MSEENKPEGRVSDDAGIKAGGNVTISDVTGQIAAGKNINQSQVQSINQTDFKELRENLLQFQKGIDKLGLEPEDKDIVNGSISAAVKETKKDKPQLSKIKDQLENINGVMKETGKTISSFSELYEPAKKIFEAVRIATSFLL
jgi:hypothetical protein